MKQIINKISLLFISLIFITGCGFGSVVASTEGVQDRICIQGNTINDSAFVFKVYENWGITEKPVIVTNFCNLIFVFEHALSPQVENGTLAGYYEKGNLFSNSPTIHIYPWLISSNGQRYYSFATVEHEFGHAMGLQHGNNPNGRMFALYSQTQQITTEEKNLMITARLRQPAPRILK